MPAVGRKRGTRRPHHVGRLRTGRPRGGSHKLSDGKPRTHEHIDAGGHKYYVKGGQIFYENKILDRRIASKGTRSRKETGTWRGDLPGKKV